MLEGGERLDELAKQTGHSAAFLRAKRSGGTLEVVQAFGQFARCLQRRTRASASFVCPGYGYASPVQALAAQNNVAGLAIIYLLEQVAAFVAGEPQASLEAPGRLQGVLGAVFAMAVRPTHVFYRALALAALHDTLPQPGQAQALR